MIRKDTTPPETARADPEDAGRTITGQFGQGNAGHRLDKALAAVIGDLSRSRLADLISGGAVTLESAVVTQTSIRVQAGQSYVVSVPPAVPADPSPQAIDLVIIHEDADVIVVDKPAGMVVHPAAGHGNGTLVNALLHHCGDSLSGIGGVARPGIVHRLDKDTSGLMVIAKTDRAHAALSAQFADRTLSRTYLALVAQVPRPPTGTIDANIGRSLRNRKRMAVVPAPRGKTAITHYRALSMAEGAALVACRLTTGRTHQIRVHLAHRGHPILGDSTYGGLTWIKAVDTSERVTFARQMLHAAALRFRHPASGDVVRFQRPPGGDMAAAIRALGLGEPTLLAGDVGDLSIPE